MKTKSLIFVLTFIFTLSFINLYAQSDKNNIKDIKIQTNIKTNNDAGVVKKAIMQEKAIKNHKFDTKTQILYIKYDPINISKEKIISIIKEAGFSAKEVSEQRNYPKKSKKETKLNKEKKSKKEEKSPKRGKSKKEEKSKESGKSKKEEKSNQHKNKGNKTKKDARKK